MRNPFHYGTPVEGDQFAGRGDELRAIVGRMRNEVSVVVVSPRRFGKTSLLRKATRQLAAEGGAVAEVNVLGCRNAASFAAALTSAVYSLQDGWWHRVRAAVPEFLKRLRIAPTVTFEADGPPTFGFDARLAPDNIDDVIGDLYAIMAAEAAQRAAVLVLDEFQAVTDLGEHLPALFKSLADQHPAVCLVLAGSKRHLMEQLVLSRNAPLYGMAERFALGPIPDDVMIDFVIRRAKDGGKPTSDATARHLIAVGGPVPDDIQHLAYETYDVGSKRITTADVDGGLANTVAHEASLHADRYERLATTQRRVLVALATEPTGEPYGATFVRRADLASASAAQRAVSALEAAELITRRDSVWQITSPFFAEWLRQLA